MQTTPSSSDKTLKGRNSSCQEIAYHVPLPNAWLSTLSWGPPVAALCKAHLLYDLSNRAGVEVFRLVVPQTKSFLSSLNLI